MPEQSPYCNPIDQQLSQFVEGDCAFKSELIEIYAKYMVDIRREFAQLVNQRNLEGVTLLHHKHKTTCHILALNELSNVFEVTRNVLESKTYDNKVFKELVIRAGNICDSALIQLREI